MTRPRNLDASPISTFVAKMIDAHKRRLQATSVAEKRAIEREMEAFLAQYFERDGVEVRPVQDAEPDVPRATQPRRVRPGPAPRYSSGDFDHKLAAAGDRTDDDD